MGKLVLCSSFKPTSRLPSWACLVQTEELRPQGTQLTQHLRGSRRPAPAVPRSSPTSVCLWPPGEDLEAGSITSIFSDRAVVKCSRLQDVLQGCSWKVNNKLDGTYLPLPVDKIIQRTKQMVNKTVQYSLIDGNCEHFVNGLRYGVPRSQQVWRAGPGDAFPRGAVGGSCVIRTAIRGPVLSLAWWGLLFLQDRALPFIAAEPWRSGRAVGCLVRPPVGSGLAVSWPGLPGQVIMSWHRPFLYKMGINRGRHFIAEVASYQPVGHIWSTDVFCLDD